MEVYQCCHLNNDNPDSLTAHQQQKIMLLEENRKALPCTQFKKDLISFIQKEKLCNGNIVPILMGDWNDTNSKTSVKTMLYQEFGLVDIFEQQFPDHKEFWTYNRGQHRLNYVLVPPWVADNVERIVYEPFMY